MSYRPRGGPRPLPPNVSLVSVAPFEVLEALFCNEITPDEAERIQRNGYRREVPVKLHPPKGGPGISHY